MGDNKSPSGFNKNSIKLVTNTHNVTSPGFPRQLFWRGDQADSIVQPSYTLPFSDSHSSNVTWQQRCRTRKGCRAPSFVRASRREFAEGRNQKSARKSRMAIILLFLPENATNHCCTLLLWYLQKPFNPSSHSS